MAQDGARRLVDVRHDRSAHLHSVVLLGHGAVIGKVIGAEVDAADERSFSVDNHDLAVQTPEQVGAQPKDARARIEHVNVDPGLGKLEDVIAGQVCSAVTVDGYLDVHAIGCSGKERFLQLDPDLVGKDDEGFQQNFGLG